MLESAVAMNLKGGPLIIGHRGSPRHSPENTMASFRQAVAVGCDMIEGDIRRTRDQVLVVIHDERVERRRIADLTLAELRTRAGTPGQVIPTLAELLDELAGRVRFDLEIKEAGYEKQVLRTVLQRLDERQFWLTSFMAGSLALLKRVHPPLTTGLLLGGGVKEAVWPVTPVRFRRLLEESGVDLVLPHHSLLKWKVVEWARQAGRGVAVWTVNRPARLARLLRQPDIAAVITDVPDVGVRLRAAAGRR
ncbi:MAG: glycerophosphodiester phosphodiesterase [Acidobacteria bacterium]|nr:glycerophosphodiester phosphodiesterase [Acidobacteriota bacterium]